MGTGVAGFYNSAVQSPKAAHQALDLKHFHNHLRAIDEA
jgi:hypothetical protein